jgi:hypothetical protein
MMKRQVASLILSLLWVLPAMAQEEVPIVPKAPQTAGEAKALIESVVSMARDLKDAEERVTETEAKTIRVAALIKTHNGMFVDGKCVFTAENPHACDAWIEDGNALNSQMDYLANLHEQAMIEKMEISSYLQLRLSKLRIMALLNGLTAWEREVVGCSKLKRDADRACLILAWERHP